MPIYDPRRARERPEPKRNKKKRRLKKQRPPKRAEKRRLHAAAQAVMPQLRAREQMPDTARRRRWRNRLRPFQNVTFNIREMIYSARWISFALLCACVYALYLIGTNPRFYVNDVKVEGASLIDPGAIVESSNLRGTHVFSIAPDVLAGEIAELPGIVAAEVQLNWPDRLQLTIVEDTPVMRWQERGKSYWVNAEGALIPVQVDDLEMLTIEADLPLSRRAFEADADAASGETYYSFIPQEVIDGALALHEQFDEAASLRFRATEGLQLTDSSGTIVNFGVGGDVQLKVATYRAISQMLGQRGQIAEYIDVSVPQKPVYKLPGGEQPLPAEEDQQP